MMTARTYKVLNLLSVINHQTLGKNNDGDFLILSDQVTVKLLLSPSKLFISPSKLFISPSKQIIELNRSLSRLRFNSMICIAKVFDKFAFI